jgi:hypothetical protein
VAHITNAMTPSLTKRLNSLEEISDPVAEPENVDVIDQPGHLTNLKSVMLNQIPNDVIYQGSGVISTMPSSQSC